MSTDAHTTTRGRKIRALLAGGLVLGVGAAVTLAAWTDDEWAIGNFGAGTFSIEGSTDGTTYDEHPVEGEAAALAYELDAANLVPGQTVAAPFAIRTTADTTYGATVTLAGSAGDGAIADDLTYGITQVATVEDCAPGAGTAVVPADTALGTAPDSAEVDLAAAAAGTAVEAAILCIQVTTADTLEQGETGTATWQFTAESVE